MKHLGHIEFKIKSCSLNVKQSAYLGLKILQGGHLYAQKINFYIEKGEENLTKFITMNSMWLKSVIL